MPIERHRPGCALLLILAAGVACGQPRSEFVDPTATGPGIRPLLELPGATLRDLRHFVAIDSSSSNGFLYLHLAGSGGLPENSQRLALFAAARGYATVSLAYPNWPSVAALTGSLGDPAAPGAVRAERLFGVDASALVEVDAANSVANRLVRLLLHQHAAHPAEGWDRFLDGDQPRWSRIVVGGHSQGAGHAAYLAQEFPLAGALLLAGPGDAVAGAGVASWLLRPLRITPTGVYGLVHQLDPDFAFFQITQGVLGLDQGGPSQDIDLVAPANWRANRLTSSRTDIPGGNVHGAVAVDAHLPPPPGYDAAWAYMLGVALFRNDFED